MFNVLCRCRETQTNSHFNKSSKISARMEEKSKLFYSSRFPKKVCFMRLWPENVSQRFLTVCDDGMFLYSLK